MDKEALVIEELQLGEEMPVVEEMKPALEDSIADIMMGRCPPTTTRNDNF